MDQPMTDIKAVKHSTNGIWRRSHNPPRGHMSADILWSRPTSKKTMMIRYLVVDIPFAYNIILGRPALNQFQVIVSTYHLKIKFRTSIGIGLVKGDQEQARRCYVPAVKENSVPGKETGMK
ncbi:UNVERIFIED_CONTAM: hypothetical protein Slati_2494600 [Sesamum latifolium]|uniref:Uncharacterized protein n=1 Tax=Sesamum latifolium TaxID=2727402 RepID=A0AAW2WHJ2_9LAMI